VRRRCAGNACISPLTRLCASAILPPVDNSTWSAGALLPLLRFSRRPVLSGFQLHAISASKTHCSPKLCKPLTHLEATLTRSPVSIDSKGFIVKLTPSESTLTKNGGRGACGRTSPNAHPKSVLEPSSYFAPPITWNFMKFVVPRIPIGVPATIPMTSPLRTRRSWSSRFSATGASPSTFRTSCMFLG
jgi:hypothetical protein